jgi:glycosyltransferase involved in cell wall biosynthesis
MESKKLKIGLLSDSPFLPTGYSNQAKQLCKYFVSKGHEVVWLANAYIGNTLDYAKMEDGTEIKCKIIGSMFGQDYFRYSISQIIKEYKIDRFIILLDTFMLFPWMLDIDFSPAKTYFYFPSDGGGGMPKGCEEILRKVDTPVAMAKFGQKQVKDYYNINTKYIPHGIDIAQFYKLPDEKKIELRRKWLLDDKFVIGVVARNQPRKNLDRTIKTMAILKDRIPNAILLMHMDPNDMAQQMFNLPSLIQKYGLENRVVFTGMQAHKGFSVEKLNEVYNLMDVFLLTTSGEGFGIPIVEAMSCEVPVLATSYTTTPELVEENQAGLGIKLSGVEEVSPNEFFNVDSRRYDLTAVNGTITGSWEVERGMCDIFDAANKLEILWKNPDQRMLMGLNGRRAVELNYDFEKVGEAWEKEILG